MFKIHVFMNISFLFVFAYLHLLFTSASFGYLIFQCTHTQIFRTVCESNSNDSYIQDQTISLPSIHSFSFQFLQLKQTNSMNEHCIQLWCVPISHLPLFPLMMIQGQTLEIKISHAALIIPYFSDIYFCLKLASAGLFF